MRNRWKGLTAVLAIATAGMLSAGAWIGRSSGNAADTLLNLGIVPAAALASDPAERAQHGDGLGRGAQHVLVSVADLATGRYVNGAEVVATVRDPRGGVQEARLVPGSAAGIPDYSGVFAFDWSGRYRVHVTVDGGRRSPVQSDFTLVHVVQ